MIRVLYMSDLHLETLRRRRSLADVLRGRAPPQLGPALKDVLPPSLIVLAGDIHNGLLSVAYADSLAKRFEVPVVLVAGNHEYYFQNLPEARQLMAKAASAT
ncbi:MAG: metallophosphoesterase, partial [Rhodospirillales bacterium]|nr:metallophosphoesterase [Rhodospirillales bacterium]